MTFAEKYKELEEKLRKKEISEATFDYLEQELFWESSEEPEEEGVKNETQSNTNP